MSRSLLQRKDRRSQTFEALERRQLMDAMTLDVRQEGTAFGAGKSIVVAENATFTLGVYLRHINGAAGISLDANNGLGGFNIALRSFGEKTTGGTKKWPSSPTPTDTVVNAESSANAQSGSVFDVGFSNGVIHDIGASPSLGYEVDADTDTDVTGMGGTQLDGGSPAYTTAIAVGSEVLLGTVTYRASDLSESSRPINRTVAINAYFTNAGGGFGGARIVGLLNGATDNGNQVGSTNLIISDSQIGAPVIVSVGNTTGTISGRVYDDRNANGIFDGTDAGISGFRVYLDQDFDGVLDTGEISKPVSATGTYTFSNVPVGTYRVREVFRAGWRQTFPAAAFYEVNVQPGTVAKSLSFANTTTVLIKGRVWMDADKDKTIDAAEGGLPGWTLYLDTDNDGIFDSNETSALSDANGNYRFDNIVAGTYVVRIVQQSKFSRTAPASGAHTITLGAGGSVSNKNFGEKRL